MQSNLVSSQPSVNVCSGIKCPFFNPDSSCSRCTRYLNSQQCHLAVVFAFKSDGSALLATNEKELDHLKQVNDNWIAQNTNNSSNLVNKNTVNKTRSETPKQIRRKSFLDDAISYPYFLYPIFSHQSLTAKKILATGINMLNSIQFEEY